MIRALILCGGSSKRLGIDKCKLKQGKLSLPELLAKKLPKGVKPLYLAKSKLFEADFLLDDENTSSPREALRKAAKALNYQGFALVLAADLLGIKKSQIKSLLKKHKQKKAQATLLKDSHLHYLCGVYELEVFRKNSANKSFGALLEGCKINSIKSKRALLNLNTITELKASKLRRKYE